MERRVGASTTAARDCLRAHIVLLRSEGVGQQEVASWLGVSAPSVSKWSQRFDREGLDGLKDKPGRGAKPSIPLATVRRVVEEAGKAPPGRQRWSTRSLAREVGISAHSVARIWQRQGLKPHRLRTFKVSRDKKFEEKFWDVVGLYLDPPERSLVLCCDEKTQCQALERTQPGLPLSRGHIKTRTHDYIRHGTVTLFAALSYLEGKLIYRTEQQHTHVEWLRFLKQIDRETPADTDLHLIADNYCTHKHEKVASWLQKHPPCAQCRATLSYSRRKVGKRRALRWASSSRVDLAITRPLPPAASSSRPPWSSSPAGPGDADTAPGRGGAAGGRGGTERDA